MGDEQGQGLARADAAMEASASSPRSRQDEPRPRKTLNCHILPWPVAPHFGTSMKHPHPSAGMALSLAGGGDPTASAAL